MAVELVPAPDRARLSPISWPAIFASLAVGLSVMLSLTLAGVALGVSVIDSGGDSARAITMGAAVWQTIGMLVAALVGGYVAARMSGLRRTADGVLHGAVSWGAATLLYAALATTAVGGLTAGMFGLLASGTSERAAPAAASVATGDREQAQRTLESIGLTAEQARTVMEKLNAPAAATISPGARQGADEVADTVGTATGWLSATVLLSLVLSTLGGVIGVRGSRRVNRRIDRRAEEPATVSETAGSPGLLSRHA
jgi:hypothetical protein